MLQKMFGEYIVYVNDRLCILVSDNTVFIKKLDCIADKMQEAICECPYSSTKEHNIRTSNYESQN